MVMGWLMLTVRVDGAACVVVARVLAFGVGVDSMVAGGHFGFS